MPQFDFAFFPSQFFWLGIFFLMQYLIISKLIVPALKSAQESRKSYIDNQLALTDTMIKQAEVLKVQYELKFEIAKNESVLKLNEALYSLQKETDESLAKLDQILNQDFKKYEKKYSKLKSSIQKDLDLIALSTAETIINRIAGVSVNAKGLNKYVN